jgi:1-acyl-sn-glycerol-3-phosphate acyltransferase
MGKKNIEKYTLPYWLLYQYSIRLHDLFYREVYTINKPKKDSEKPNILTPNHQNALMDALAVGFALKQPLVFLARSDIFKKKAVASILYFLKILPIYRIRDGFDSLKNNQETFEHTVRVLNNKRALVILPEGNHFGAKRLRTLKKGFARIAFSSELAGNEEIDLHIVPVAIDYSSYDSFFSRLTVVFGEPFPLKPYMESYKEKPQIAINNITKDLSDRLKDHIIHIETEEAYNESLLAVEVYAETKEPGFTNIIQNKRYNKQRETAKALNKVETDNSPKWSEIIQNASLLKKKTKDLPHEIIGTKPSGKNVFYFILSLLFAPIAIPGLIIFGPFWYLPLWFANKKIKDVQFRTSVRYGMSVFLYLIQFIAILIFLFTSYTPGLAMIIFFSTVITGVLSIKTFQLNYWYYLKAKWYRISKNNPELLTAKEKMIENIDNLMDSADNE